MRETLEKGYAKFVKIKTLKGGMIMKNKNGISAVVATVLIILITVAAVTIIWAAIIPMINNQLSRGTVCLDAMTQLTIEDKGYTCYNAGSDVKVQVAHGSQDIGLTAIQVLVSNDVGDTTSYEVSTNLPGINEKKVITVGHSDADPQSVSVAPIVSVGGQEVTCDELAPVMIKPC